MINFVLSLLVWLIIISGTVVLFCVGLVVLWPLSQIFEYGSGGLLHGLSQFWASLIVTMTPFWDIAVEGRENIVKGENYVVVSNHQSMLDILVVLSRLPLHFKFIAKKELFWIPFFGWHLALAKYISLNRADAESGRNCLVKARAWLRRGVSVLFFPEGTRSPDGKIHEFKAGAFKMSLEEKKAILPLVLYGTREAVPKSSWRIRKRAPLKMKILPPVAVAGHSILNLDQIRNEVRDLIVREFEGMKRQAQIRSRL